MLRVFCLVMAVVVIVIVFGVGRSGVPGYVIPPGDMSKIMADLHIAESVVEANYGAYQSDSAKMLLKQSVLARHGYSLHDLDTSFMWYGGNLKKFDQIFEDEIEILQKRLAEAGAVTNNRKGSEVRGDSVDIWGMARFYMIRPGMVSQNIAFNVKAGEDWRKGDVFTIRAKFSNVTGPLSWSLSSDYDDGSIEVLSSRFSNDGWHEMTFYADTLKTSTRIYGALSFETKTTPLLVDSIELIRKPIQKDIYPQRYRQRSYDYYNHKPAKVEKAAETPASERPADNPSDNGSTVQNPNERNPADKPKEQPKMVKPLETRPMR